MLSKTDKEFTPELFSCGCYQEPIQVQPIQVERIYNYVKQKTAGQSSSQIVGNVLGEDGMPIPFVSVAVIGTTMGVIADVEGHYIIENVPSGLYSLEFSMLGFNHCIIPNIALEERTWVEIIPVQLCAPRIQLLKPVLYLYPTETSEIEVKLNYEGRLEHTYPRYEEGWKIKANPDGTLLDAKGRSYYALFWEGAPYESLSMPNGFMVAKEETIDFLEKSLDQLGLSEREANEFIMFWLPQLEQNAFNYIHFSTSEYEESCVLQIEPRPETVIRVMMVYEALDGWKKVKQQNLPPKPERTGFTVVEWGGSVFQLKNKTL